MQNNGFDRFYKTSHNSGILSDMKKLNLLTESIVYFLFVGRCMLETTGNLKPYQIKASDYTV